MDVRQFRRVALNIEEALDPPRLEPVPVGIGEAVDGVPALEGPVGRDHREALGGVLVGLRVVVFAHRKRHVGHTAVGQDGERSTGLLTRATLCTYQFARSQSRPGKCGCSQ